MKEKRKEGRSEDLGRERGREGKGKCQRIDEISTENKQQNNK